MNIRTFTEIFATSMGKKKKRSLIKRLTYHYRLLVINEDTYEEKISYRLNRLNVFVFTTLFALLLVVGTIVLISFTPLRSYIPGYTAPKLRKQAIDLKFKTDSLENELVINTFYINQLQKVFKGELTMDEFEKDFKQTKINPDTLKLMPGKADSLLRKEVEEREHFSVGTSKRAGVKYHFIAPVKGNVTTGFERKKKHFAVDVAVKKNTPIKVIANGTIIFSSWTSDTGNVVVVEHPNNIISIYKHNNKLLKNVGDFVKQGEVIALSGNTGEKTTGPHLHFELWIKGYPMNPEDFLSFKK